jgi:long-chain fatty acid transport protein
MAHEVWTRRSVGAPVRTAPAAMAAMAAAWLHAPALAHAGGFYVPEVGPRALGMSGAMTAQADERDTTAIFHNPAGLAGPEGTRIQAAGNLFFPNVEFWRAPVDDPSTGDRIRFARTHNTNRVGGAPYVGAASDVTIDDLAIGIGVFVPFGAHLSYPRDSDGRHVVTEVNLRTIYVAPTIAYRILDRVSVGAGLNYIYSDIALDQVNSVLFLTGNPEFSPDPDPELDGISQLRGRDPASFSANFGVQYHDPEDRFAFGASVMTPTKLRFRGPAQIINAQVAPLLNEEGEEVQPSGVRKDDFSLEYPLPLVLRLGTMFRPHDQVMVAVDYNWQRWKTFDVLTVEFENNFELLPTPGAFMHDVVIEQHWTNSHSVRMATEVAPLPPDRLPLFLRGGVVLDSSPIPDQYFDHLAPDSDKVGVSVGVGYTFALGKRVKLDADLGFMHLFLKKRDIRPVRVGTEELIGNDDDAVATNDTFDSPFDEVRPGSNKTILNKPASSFYHGVTRAFFDILGVGVTVRL